MKNPSLPYVAPFAAFVLLLGLEGRIPLSPEIEYPARVVILSLVLYFCSRHVIDLRVSHWFASSLLGIAVFLIWIGPEFLFPGWRDHWLFRNALTGRASETPEYAVMGWSALSFRFIRAACLVPVIEELFWRAWMMRWIITQDFFKVPLGAYSRGSFWITAVLFASEHGRYWEVGLLAGVLYNGWMLRTKSLGDCVLAHAVTNTLLSAYVLGTGKWQFW